MSAEQFGAVDTDSVDVTDAAVRQSPLSIVKDLLPSGSCRSRQPPARARRLDDIRPRFSCAATGKIITTHTIKASGVERFIKYS
jgi:hypothetical protein